MSNETIKIGLFFMESCTNEVVLWYKSGKTNNLNLFHSTEK